MSAEPTIPVIKNEPDPNVTPLPSHPGKNTFFARLRSGHHIQVGADPNDKDSFIHGPVDLPITPQMAIAHMSKWDDPNAVKLWLATAHPKLIAGKPHLQPRREKRLTPAERMEKAVKQASAVNAARNSEDGRGLNVEEVKALIKAHMKPMDAKLNQIIAALGGEPPTADLEPAKGTKA